jgi:hypothetical protein
LNVVGLGEQHQACLWDSPLSVARAELAGRAPVSQPLEVTEDLQTPAGGKA